MSAHKYEPECPVFAVTQTGHSLRRGAIVEGMGLSERGDYLFVRVPDRGGLSLDQVRPLTPAAVDMLAGDA